MIYFLKKFYPTLSLICLICFLSLASFKSLPSTPTLPHMDKVVHFCMYAALSYVLLFDLTRTHSRQKIHTKKIIETLLIAICMGGLMELTQGYLTTTRSADWWDMLANTSGAIAGTTFGRITLPAIYKLYKKR
ncbi:MAG: VanZ family protein [Bacteroidales bacterium]